MKSNQFIIVIFTIVAFSFTSCKSKKKAIENGELNKRLTAKELVKAYNSKTVNFKTLASRVKVDVIEGENSKGYTVNLRMEKDKQILLSSTPITVVKALITPERVAFYNKLDGTYFDGDFSYLSKLLGTELDYKKVQNLLLGEAIYDVDATTYAIDIHEKSYMLAPNEQSDLYELFLLFNPKHFKLDSQQIAQKKTSRFLEVNYPSYQDVDNQKFPEAVKIIVVEDKEQLGINLELKSLTLNEKLRFPFKIPQGYKKIELE